MNTDSVDLNRRRFLTAATAAVGAVGTGFVAVPFISAMQPSARAKAAGAPVEVDISKLAPGQLIRAEWRGKPVWILNRTEAALNSLAEVEHELSDPDSEDSLQPEFTQNKERSIKPEIFIAVGICTHLGCSPTFRPEVAPADLGSDWPGGFFCPCHGSKFDYAGRVYSGVPAPTNLEIPPHYYITDTRLLIGESKEVA